MEPSTVKRIRDLIPIAQRESPHFLETYIGEHVLVVPPQATAPDASWTLDTRLSGSGVSLPGSNFKDYEVVSLRGRLRLLHRVVSVGRAPYNDVVIAHESISKIHAKFEIRSEQLRLTDVGSTTGTLVNGRALAPGEKQLVQHNDDITFGDRTFKLYRTVRLHSVLTRLVDIPVLDLDSDA